MYTNSVNSIFKLGEHLTKRSWCDNCVREAVDYEMKHKEQLANLADGWTFE